MNNRPRAKATTASKLEMPLRVTDNNFFAFCENVLLSKFLISFPWIVRNSCSIFHESLGTVPPFFERLPSIQGQVPWGFLSTLLNFIFWKAAEFICNQKFFLWIKNFVWIYLYISEKHLFLDSGWRWDFQSTLKDTITVCRYTVG